ncbi:MAG: hypothetical protein WC284_19120 [Candidimonas sp.]
MPLSGQGMLITAMDVDPERERDFNLWYDKEHLVDRVILPGFIEARRYIAVQGGPRYLNYYTTDTFDVLTSEGYKTARKNHTPWGRQHVPHFRNGLRVTARVAASLGQGRGGVNAFIRLRPGEGRQAALEQLLRERCADVLPLDDIISAHLLIGQADDPGTPKAEATDWYLMLEGTEVESVAHAAQQHFGDSTLQGLGLFVSCGVYRLQWDLGKWDLNP